MILLFSWWKESLLARPLCQLLLSIKTEEKLPLLLSKWRYTLVGVFVVLVVMCWHSFGVFFIIYIYIFWLVFYCLKVFPPFKLIPRKVTLLIGAMMQVRVIIVLGLLGLGFCQSSFISLKNFSRNDISLIALDVNIHVSCRQPHLMHQFKSIYHLFRCFLWLLNNEVIWHVSNIICFKPPVLEFEFLKGWEMFDFAFVTVLMLPFRYSSLFSSV